MDEEIYLPDPTRPIPAYPSSFADGRVGRSSQRERRSRILAATRIAIAESGDEEVSVRDVAGRSNVAVQTIYNLIGNRAQLVEDAINEHIANTASRAHKTSNYPNTYLAIADLTWMSIVHNRTYSQNIIRSCHQKYFFAYKNICTRNAQSLSKLIKRSQVSATGIAEAEALALHITTLVGSSALDWAMELYDLAELRYRFAFAYGAPLIPLVAKEEANEITGWIGELRDSALHSRKDGPAQPWSRRTDLSSAVSPRTSR